MMRRGIVVEEDERAKSNRPCGGNEGLSLVTLTIIARAEANYCMYATAYLHACVVQ